MKKITNKILIYIVSASALCVCSPWNMKEINAKAPLIQEQEYEPVPCADQIVHKYRKYNGVYQYRRWNETKNCWVDPYWITV